MAKIIFQEMGGVNYADKLNGLIARAFSAESDGSFSQKTLCEFRDARNIDYFPEGFGKRAGSSLNSATINGLLVSGDSAVRGFAYTQAGGTETQVVVTKKTIYINTGSGWVQATNSSSAAYTHASDVTKCSFAVGDGRLFIGLDGANNYIQVLRSGTQLDDEMKTGNSYHQSYGGSTDTITGTFDKTCYIVFYMQGRLCYVSNASGPTVVQYTAASEIYARDEASGGGFWQMGGNIIAAGTFARRSDNMLNEVMYALTSNGLEFLTGFTASDQPMRMEGSGKAINYRSVCKIRNWLLYATTDGTIEIANLSRFDDAGRRFKATDGSRGPLTTLDVGVTADSGFMFYDATRRQALFWYDESTTAWNGLAVGLDFLKGEPGAGEPLESFEQHVRAFVWTLTNPDVNEWFCDVFTTDDGILGLTRDGYLWNFRTGLNDLDNFAVDDSFTLPDFDAGAPTRVKDWRRFAMLLLPKGAWNLTTQAFLDYDDSASGDDVVFAMAPDSASIYDTAEYDIDSYSSSGAFSVADWLELSSYVIHLTSSNGEADHNWVIAAIELEYEIGSEQD